MPLPATLSHWQPLPLLCPDFFGRLNCLDFFGRLKRVLFACRARARASLPEVEIQIQIQIQIQRSGWDYASVGHLVCLTGDRFLDKTDKRPRTLPAYVRPSCPNPWDSAPTP